MISLLMVFGIPLRMHFAFPVLVVCALFLRQGAAILVLLIALFLHEAAHALAALALGRRMESIELMPFGGVARMADALTLRPAHELIIALAGPACSLFFAFLIFFSRFTGLFARELFQANLALAAVNLLPALPLDGGRALRALFSARLGRARATKLFARVGVALGVLILLLGLFAATQGVINPMLFLMGAYLIYAALEEKESLAAAQIAALHGRMARLRREGILPVRLYAVEQGTQPERLAAKLGAGVYHLFIPVDEKLQHTGMLDEGQILREFLEGFHL